jgi:hypothetical protein
VKFYCGICWEEMGNCHPWCPELDPSPREQPRPEDADNDPDQTLNDGDTAGE